MTDERLQKLNSLPLRDDLRGQSPYGAPQIDVPIQLNVNENTHPVPDVVVESIAKAVEDAARTLNRYPDRDAVDLRRDLAAYLGHGLTYENVWAANGSNEVLQQILQAFGGPGRAVLSFPPTYSMYPLLAAGVNTEYIAGVRAEDYSLSAESAAAQVREHRPQIVFLCSPNNPTGTALGLDVVRAVYEAGEENNTIVVVDEAYAEFALEGTKSALTLLPGRTRLIVTRTMSKAFALAGARLGYLAAAPEIVDALQLVRLPYHLSAVTQATARAALSHADVLQRDVEDIKTQRDRIVAEVRALGLFPAVSDSNFVTFGGLSDPHAVFEALLEEGIIIRDNGLPGHLRVTAGTEEETTAFLVALRRYVGSHPEALTGHP
ncbi:histidinol-phosphate transaminase [Galactobacter sp.]|uniref:histidinol-phosphate transaminase n=1 Tax=Galactobacter sp. TaxID=2676125 RepID=UPI0025C645F5|nr:histidinol-phosphate transaminase [Galactobacter sp.]